MTLIGGLDLVTPPIGVQPGSVIACRNYECDVLGYRRMFGYEAFDGQPKPSAANYYLIDFDAGTTAISEDDVVTGATSGATGIALRDATLASGSWAGSDAAGELILYNVTGTFQDNENLQVSAATVAVADGLAVEGAAETDTLHSTYTQEAIEKRRAVITAVPGSGSVLGVFTYKGDIFAIRNNAGGTAAVMHKATTSGWSAQSFGDVIDFTGGGMLSLVEGETVTGGTSGATATVRRVVHTSGAWASSAAAGYLVLSGTSGTFQAAETLTGGTSGGTATATAAQTAITLPAGGKYRTISHNFFGASNLRRIYMANGVGYAHEWDGTVLAPIKTGVDSALDKPKFVGVVGTSLFLGYDGGSLQFSGINQPVEYNADKGGGEIGLGEDLTGFKSHTSTAAIITGRNVVAYISGTSAADFQVNYISEDSGALTDTLEVVGQPLFLDDRGVRDMQAADTYGDFRIGTITRKIEPFIKRQRAAGITPVGTLRVRSRDILRLFYSDGTAISVYFGRKAPECMILEIGFTPTVMHSGESSLGDEVLLAGDTGGFVYEMDAGTSFNGALVPSYLRTSFLHQGQPNTVKRYHSATVELDAAGGGTSISFTSDYAYGNPDLPSGSEVSASIFGGGGYWDESLWENFYWSSPVQGTGDIRLQGIGKNVSLVFMSDATYEQPHTLTSLSINYTMRRQHRAA